MKQLQRGLSQHIASAKSLVSSRLDSVISVVNRKTDDVAMIRRQENKEESKPLNLSDEGIDDKLTRQTLSTPQAHWLSIGENIGAWLKSKLSRKSGP